MLKLKDVGGSSYIEIFFYKGIQAYLNIEVVKIQHH